MANATEQRETERIHLTPERIRKMKPPARQAVYVFDDDPKHLCVRTTPTGAKAFVFRSKLRTISIRVTIGAVDTWNLDDARAQARRLQVIIDQGKDPRQVAAEEVATEQARLEDEQRKEVIVSEAWAAYVAACSHEWGVSHKRDHERAVKPGGEPRGRGRRANQGDVTYPGLIYPLLSLRLADLTAECLQAWLEEANKRGRTEAAKNFRLLRTFINWCAERGEYRGIVVSDAHAKREVRALVKKVSAKKLAIQKEQLYVWFDAIQKISNPTASAYLQVLLLTGARREELARLKWIDCDFLWRSMHLKDKVQEDGRDIPMTPYVHYLIASQPRRNEYVFSSPSAAAGYIADPLAPLQKAMRSAGLPNFSPHDLRRSFSSLSEWCEVPAGVVAQIMGHQPSATAEKHYKPRPLDLLRMWHTRIETFILEQASIVFAPEQAGLRVISAA